MELSVAFERLKEKAEKIKEKAGQEMKALISSGSVYRLGEKSLFPRIVVGVPDSENDKLYREQRTIEGLIVDEEKEICSSLRTYCILTPSALKFTSSLERANDNIAGPDRLPDYKKMREADFTEYQKYASLVFDVVENELVARMRRRIGV